MGPQTHSTRGGGHTNHSLRFPGPSRGSRQAKPSHLFSGGHSPPQRTIPTGTHVPVPNPGTHPGGMEIQGDGRLIYRHYTSEGYLSLSLIDSIEFPTGAISPEGNRETSQDTKTHILDLAHTLQAILGEAMDTAITMFPHKEAPALSRRTLPRDLWPNSVRHDVSNIRRRAKAIRRLIRLEANPPTDTQDDSSHPDTHLSLWSIVSMSLQLRTVLPPSHGSSYPWTSHQRGSLPQAGHYPSTCPTSMF